jgi:2-phospho-L-lactate guanylyltransferase
VSWTVIVPLKHLDAAKSRLRGVLGGLDHAGLVAAMAVDTIVAALASPVVSRVVVVTDDERASQEAVSAGAEVISDVPAAGLNPALAYAASLVHARGSVSLPGVAALAADLPCLRTADLTEALRAVAAAAPLRAYVADASGTGTVMLAAPDGVALEPCFGEGSAAAHLASGAVALCGDWPSLRRDVDTPADLAEAVVLGVGPRTADVMRRCIAAAGG